MLISCQEREVEYLWAGEGTILQLGSRIQTRSQAPPSAGKQPVEVGSQVRNGGKAFIQGYALLLAVGDQRLSQFHEEIQQRILAKGMKSCIGTSPSSATEGH